MSLSHHIVGDVAIDSFRREDFRQTCHHVLTHIHTDHMAGLQTMANWPPDRLVHCSPETKRMLRVRAPKLPQENVVEHTIEKVFRLGQTRVTFFDAHHCEGAVVCVFESDEIGKVLHTGDFRYSRLLRERLQVSHRYRPFDRLILDVTSGTVTDPFPCDAQVAKELAKAIGDTKKIVVVRIRTIAREKMLQRLYRELGLHPSQVCMFDRGIYDLWDSINIAKDLVNTELVPPQSPDKAPLTEKKRLEAAAIVFSQRALRRGCRLWIVHQKDKLSTQVLSDFVNVSFNSRFPETVQRVCVREKNPRIVELRVRHAYHSDLAQLRTLVGDLRPRDATSSNWLTLHSNLENTLEISSLLMSPEKSKGQDTSDGHLIQVPPPSPPKLQSSLTRNSSHISLLSCDDNSVLFLGHGHVEKSNSPVKRIRRRNSSRIGAMHVIPDDSSDSEDEEFLELEQLETHHCSNVHKVNQEREFQDAMADSVTSHFVNIGGALPWPLAWINAARSSPGMFEPVE
ncbi:MAG: hypothetical protein MHM6MM_002027 [Cercozoa sp. M6MM]